MQLHCKLHYLSFLQLFKSANLYYYIRYSSFNLHFLYLFDDFCIHRAFELSCEEESLFFEKDCRNHKAKGKCGLDIKQDLLCVLDPCHLCSFYMLHV